MAVDGREAADLILLHRSDRFLDGIIGTDRDGFALAELPGGRRAGVPAVCQAFDDDVPLGQHAFEPVVSAADRQGPDVQVLHFRAACSRVSFSPTHSAQPLMSSRAVVVSTSLG